MVISNNIALKILIRDRGSTRNLLEIPVNANGEANCLIITTILEANIARKVSLQFITASIATWRCLFCQTAGVRKLISVM